MRRLHLVARAPNEGSRQLARWIIRECGGCIAVAAQRIGIEAGILQRLVDGDLLPGDALRGPLFFRAGIGRGQFARPASGGWFDQPGSVAA